MALSTHRSLNLLGTDGTYWKCDRTRSELLAEFWCLNMWLFSDLRSPAKRNTSPKLKWHKMQTANGLKTLLLQRKHQKNSCLD